MKKTTYVLIIMLVILSTLSFGYADTNRSFIGEEDTFDISPAFSSKMWFDEKSGSYTYPVKPGSSEWLNFNTYNEMLEACTIPDDILHKISTEDLVKLVLDYPLLYDYKAFSSDQQGLETLIGNFNGLRELIEREDGIIKLIEAYQKMDIKDESLPSRLENASDNNFVTELKKFEKENKSAYNDLMDTYKNNIDIEFIETMLNTFKSKLTTKEKAACEKVNLLKQEIIIPESLDDSLKASIVIKTPSGKTVPASQYIYNRAEMSDAEIKKAKTYVTSAFPKATVLRAATNKYNCHSYAWYSQAKTNKVWLNTCITYRTDSKSYKSKNGLIKANDKVVYSADKHSGIIASINGDNTGLTSTVKSKWGSLPLMQHKVLYVPASYGAKLTFFGRV